MRRKKLLSIAMAALLCITAAPLGGGTAFSFAYTEFGGDAAFTYTGAVETVLSGNADVDGFEIMSSTGSANATMKLGRGRDAKAIVKEQLSGTKYDALTIEAVSSSNASVAEVGGEFDDLIYAVGIGTALVTIKYYIDDEPDDEDYDTIYLLVVVNDAEDMVEIVETGATYNTVGNALDEAEEGQTIKVLEDGSFSDIFGDYGPAYGEEEFRYLWVDSVVLDLNGKTITAVPNFTIGLTGDSPVLKNGTLIGGTNADEGSGAYVYTGYTYGVASYTAFAYDATEALFEGITSVNSGLNLQGGSEDARNTVTIKNTSLESGTFYGIYVGGYTDLVIESGSFLKKASSDEKKFYIDNNNLIGNYSENGTVVIKGGTFKKGYSSATLAADPTLVTIKGGTFDWDPSSCNIPAGYSKKTNEDETYSVVDERVATIGDVGYMTLAAAVAAAEVGDTITLMADDRVSLVKSGSTITISKAITITGPVDGEGKPIYTIYGCPTAGGGANNRIFINTNGAPNPVDITIANLNFREFGNEVANNSKAVPIITSQNCRDDTTIQLKNLDIREIGYSAVLANGGYLEITDCYIDCAKNADGVEEDFTKGITIQTKAKALIKNNEIVGAASTYDVWDAAAIEILHNADVAVENCTISSFSVGVGVEIFKDDEHAKGTIRDTQISAYESALLSGAYESVSSGTAEIFIESGSYEGSLTIGEDDSELHFGTADRLAIEISGGIFSEDPSEHVAEGYAAVANDDPETIKAYPWKVTIKEVDVDTDVTPKETSVTTSSKDETVLGIITELNSYKVEGAEDLTAAARTLANDDEKITDELIQQAEAALSEAGINTAGHDTLLVIEPYLDTRLREAESDDEEITSITYEIKPKYNLYASTEDEAEKRIMGGTGQNTTLVSSGLDLDVPEGTEVDISLPIPAGLAKKNGVLRGNVYVQHKSHEYNAEVKDTSGGAPYYAAFTNPDGFSEFVISAESTAAASIGSRKYTSVQAAFDAVLNGETVNILKNDSDELSAIAPRRAETFSVAAADGAKLPKTITSPNAKRYNVNSVAAADGKSMSVMVSYVPGSTPADDPESSSGGSGSGSGGDGGSGSSGGSGGGSSSGSGGSSSGSGGSKTVVNVSGGSGSGASAENEDKADDNLDDTGSENEGAEDSGKIVFLDVPDFEWYPEYVDYVASRGIMTGVYPHYFMPEMPMTRAMVVTVLWRMQKSPAAAKEQLFPDVIPGEYYVEAMNWGVANGVVKGYEEGYFAPDQGITREELALVLFRYMDFCGKDVSLRGDISMYVDWRDVSDWALEAVLWANGAGIINGRAFTNDLYPQGYATRADVAAMLTRILKAEETMAAD